MTGTPRTSARSAPLNHRRELTREEVRRELRRSQAYDRKAAHCWKIRSAIEISRGCARLFPREAMKWAQDPRVLLCIVVALVFTIWVALQQIYY